MRQLLVILAAAVLCGCPQERPDTQRRVPAERFPAAVTVEPAPLGGGGATGGTVSPPTTEALPPLGVMPPADPLPAPEANPPGAGAALRP